MSQWGQITTTHSRGHALMGKHPGNPGTTRTGVKPCTWWRIVNPNNRKFHSREKFVAALAVVPLVFSLAACGSSSNNGNGNKKVTIGVVGTEKANDVLKEEAAKQGIDIEYQEFTDYNQPNPSVESGDTDLNRFQHIAYLASYNVNSGKDLQIVGSTNIYPMALFSQKHKKVDEIPQDGTIAVPNDPVNEARAILLLKAQNLVTLKSDVHSPTHDDIDTEKSKVKVTPVDASQTVVSWTPWTPPLSITPSWRMRG